MFDRFFMDGLSCNMLEYFLYCQVCEGLELFLASWLPVLVLFLSFSFSFLCCSLPWLSSVLFFVLSLPLLAPRCFSLLLFVDFLRVFVGTFVVTVSSVFSPSMNPWFPWKDHAPQEDHQALRHTKTLESFYQYKTFQ